MYTINSRVRYSEVDAEGLLSLDSIINYMQDCSSFQSEDLNVGIDYLKQNNKAWLLNSWQIIIDRYPKFSEEIAIGTQAYDFKGMFGYRNFVILDEKKEYLARANSLWVLIDTTTGKPIRITPGDVDCYGKADPIPMDYAPRKIALPSSMESLEPFQVKAHHIDTNHHVNNGQYIQMARECIPEDFHVGQMRAEYKKQAKLGGIVIPFVGKNETGYTVNLCDEERNSFAVVSFA
ncbi:MAG: acyl-[acyl-carrier-protein] thioesterase [Lachnospiraceae bacterium]